MKKQTLVAGFLCLAFSAVVLGDSARTVAENSDFLRTGRYEEV